MDMLTTSAVPNASTVDEMTFPLRTRNRRTTDGDIRVASFIH
jgi:hypothetical protein